MRRLGCFLLTLWTVLNLVPSIWIALSSSFLGADSPAIYQILNPQEVDNLTVKERSSINAVAVYANGLNAALCTCMLFLLWYGVYRRQAWAFWAVLAGLCLALLAGTLADYTVGWAHPEVNLISGLILLLGFGCCAIDLFLPKKDLGERHKDKQ